LLPIKTPQTGSPMAHRRQSNRSASQKTPRNGPRTIVHLQWAIPCSVCERRAGVQPDRSEHPAIKLGGASTIGVDIGTSPQARKINPSPEAIPNRLPRNSVSRRRSDGFSSLDAFILLSFGSKCVNPSISGRWTLAWRPGKPRPSSSLSTIQKDRPHDRSTTATVALPRGQS